MAYFNPRSPDGERLAIWSRIDCNTDISIHAPRMGSDGHQHVLRNHHHHISIHAPRMGSDHLPSCGVLAQVGISIHAPRMGSDARAPRCGIAAEFISIHAPRMGSDWVVSSMPWMGPVFQSTLPGWGATCYAVACNRSIEFQSTLPGWGATVAFDLGEVLAVFISIHAPRMGSDNDNNVLTPDFKISIHAPRMGSDL
ncbi:hypothetical protein NRBB11_1422 [Bifidobacterium breve]|nr:hypothetical protein NRBB11_1422 [Bifidobacterium breve]